MTVLLVYYNQLRLNSTDLVVAFGVLNIADLWALQWLRPASRWRAATRESRLHWNYSCQLVGHSCVLRSWTRFKQFLAWYLKSQRLKHSATCEIEDSICRHA